MISLTESIFFRLTSCNYALEYSQVIDDWIWVCQCAWGFATLEGFWVWGLWCAHRVCRNQLNLTSTASLEPDDEPLAHIGWNLQHREPRLQLGSFDTFVQVSKKGYSFALFLTCQYPIFSRRTQLKFDPWMYRMFTTLPANKGAYANTLAKKSNCFQNKLFQK